MRRTVSGALLSLVVVGCGGPPAMGSGAMHSGEDSRPAGGSACLEEANSGFAKNPHEPPRVGVRHILVRHGESKNPDGETRTREQACLRALEARKKLEAGKDWNDVVTAYSDERGAADRHGVLGVVSREDLDPAFADAAFSLDVEATSYVVETKAGFHVIQRTE